MRGFGDHKVSAGKAERGAAVHKAAATRGGEGGA